MNLTFTKENGSWVAEFEATTDFNVHIEGVVESGVVAYQRTTPTGEFSLVRGSIVYPSYGKVYDMDFVGVVYPKYIKLVCETEPTFAEITEAASGEEPVAKEFTFTIDGFEGYTALEGMTWKEWIDSDYCPKNEDESFSDNGTGFVYAYWVVGDSFPLSQYGYVYENNIEVGINDLISPVVNYVRGQM